MVTVDFSELTRRRRELARESAEYETAGDGTCMDGGGGGGGGAYQQDESADNYHRVEAGHATSMRVLVMTLCRQAFWGCECRGQDSEMTAKKGPGMEMPRTDLKDECQRRHHKQGQGRKKLPEPVVCEITPVCIPSKMSRRKSIEQKRR